MGNSYCHQWGKTFVVDQPRSVLEKFSAVQMIDVHLPTSDGREVVLTRHTQPEPDLEFLLRGMKLELPPQPPPKITAAAIPSG